MSDENLRVFAAHDFFKDASMTILEKIDAIASDVLFKEDESCRKDDYLLDVYLDRDNFRLLCLENDVSPILKAGVSGAMYNEEGLLGFARVRIIYSPNINPSIYVSKIVTEIPLCHDISQ